MVLLPIGIYYASFLPYWLIPDEKMSLYDLFVGIHLRMWDGQLRVITFHPYTSTWLDWPLLSRPIWYAYDHEIIRKNFVRGVLLLGNPLIMWSGLLAILVCLRDWLRTRNRTPFLICFFYFTFYVCWILIPRKISFYYYYYPAGMMLSLALGYIFHDKNQRKLHFEWEKWIFLGASFGLFIYFFPILAAIKIPENAFQHWMWFRSWI